MRSRPPLPYRLVWSGRYYEVWQRPADFAGPLPEHLALGSEFEPSAVPGCGEVGGLGELALLHQMSEAHAGRRPPRSRSTTPTKARLTVPRPGRYAAWLLGSVRGSVELWVDGRKVGEARHQLENEGGFIELGEPRLRAGRMRSNCASAAPTCTPAAAASPARPPGPLLFSPAGDPAGRLVSVPVAESERLCGKPWDWIEAVSGGG